MTKIVNFLMLLVGVLLVSCGEDNHTHAEESHKEEKMEPIAENEVVLTDKEIAAVGISWERLEDKALNNTLKVNGVLSVPNHNKAFVSADYSGIVQTITVHPGSVVRKGQVIATIKNPDLLAIQQRLEEVRTSIKMAELELSRQQQLVEGNAAPLKRMQQAQTELQTLKSIESGILQQLKAIGASTQYSSVIVLRAPISGIITNVMAQIGSSVSATLPIAEIVNNEELHLDLFVFEKDLPKVENGQIVHFRLTNNPEKEYDAKVFSIAGAFEDVTKTVQVHAEVQGEKTGLIEGMNVTANLSIEHEGAPVLPDNAIVLMDEKYYVFVVDEAAAKQNTVTFERVQVVKKTSELELTEIAFLTPLPAGKQVVTKGAFFVKAKMTNTGEHSH